ncbi:transporter substrate-binding domain-containing protein [Maridesulfovibrio sp.]|uniref:substrate-binding periplasmic protein n=1 Tax=Maridesulfovibrio sp. TaxID=2795000 RepID=UPI0029F5CB4A|nr:transporter substrate-binding domain-containing protein [Maridesulfovibrio sp.]
MKYTIYFLISILTCLSIEFHDESIAHALEKKVTVAGDLEKENGYLVKITNAAFLRVGYEPEFIFLPWIRAITGTIEGEYDVLLAAYHTDDREKELRYSDPIGTAVVVLLKLRSKNVSFNKIEDLAQYRIGHIKGSKVSTEFDKAEKEYLNVQYVVDTTLNLKKLLKHRIDLVVEKKERIEALLQTTFRDSANKFAYVDPPLKINNYYNCSSRKNKRSYQIIQDFNRGLSLIKEDGTYDAILKHHNISAE